MSLFNSTPRFTFITTHLNLHIHNCWMARIFSLSINHQLASENEANAKAEATSYTSFATLVCNLTRHGNVMTVFNWKHNCWSASSVLALNIRVVWSIPIQSGASKFVKEVKSQFHQLEVKVYLNDSCYLCGSRSRLSPSSPSPPLKTCDLSEYRFEIFRYIRVAILYLVRFTPIKDWCSRT